MSAAPSEKVRLLEVPIAGMDCAECSQQVQQALAVLPGVQDVRVLLTAEKALLHIDPTQIDLPAVRKAVEGAGYRVPETESSEHNAGHSRNLRRFTHPIFTLFGLVFGAVLLVVIAGEWLGLFERVTDLVPWYLGWGLVLLASYPIFWNVLKAALRRQVISHTLMSLGVVAALAVGQWPTAVVILFGSGYSVSQWPQPFSPKRRTATCLRSSSAQQASSFSLIWWIG